MSNTTLTVTFIAPEEDADITEANEAIALSLDSEANNNETSFESGTPAYVKQFPPGEFEMTVNIGSVEKRLRRVPYTIEHEKIYFANVATKNMVYLPEGEVIWAWIGTELGNPTFNGKVIVIPEAGIGVLCCTYITLYDQLQVIYNGDEETTVLLVVINRGDEEDEEDDVQDSLLITYTGVESETERPVTITVKNYCSNEIVVGARIEVTAPGYPTTNFVTDDLGQADLGNLVVGTTYNIKTTVVGYRDSDIDSLSNDSFIVTAIPKEDEEEEE